MATSLVDSKYVDDYNFEVVQSFKYLGSILNVTNDIEEEIKFLRTESSVQEILGLLCK